jgi:NADH-quinone oxidoreductase subunit L
MTVALGASAYSVAVFHLMTHAFFKALLFLAAGSVIIGMHHDQDIRHMGGLRKHMPLTWITSLLGSLALIGTPLFAGFYSKDSIIEAVHASHLPGAGFAWLAVTAGVFVTAFYSFRMYFLVFHGAERFGQTHAGHEGDHDDEEPAADHHHGLAPGDKPHESPWVVTAPLVLLAVPSVVIGFLTIQPMLYGEFLKDSIVVDAARHPAMAELAQGFHGATAMALHGLTTLPFWLALAGVVTAWWFYLKQPSIPAAIAQRLRPIMTLLENKYYMDWINEHLLAPAARAVGTGLWKGGDEAVIDGAINGSARGIGGLAGVMRGWQTGRLYQYALVMLLGIFGLLTWKLWPFLSGLLR